MPVIYKRKEVKKKKEAQPKDVVIVSGRKKTGRPPIYGPNIIAMTENYIDSCGDKIEVRKKLHLELDGSVKHVNGEPFVTSYEEKVFKLPSLEGLALYLGVNKDTVQDWKKDITKPEFSVLISELLSKQAEMLIGGGITGKYNPVISKVLLSKHGYSERIENTGAEGKDLIPDKQSDEKAEKALNTFLKKKK